MFEELPPNQSFSWTWSSGLHLWPFRLKHFIPVELPQIEHHQNRNGMPQLAGVSHDWSSDSGNSSMHFDFSEEGRWVWTLKYKFSVSLLFLPRLVQMSHRFVAKSICSQWCWTSIVSKNHICIFLRTGVDVEHTSVFTQCDVYPTVLIVIQKKKMWKSPKTNFNLLCYRFNEGFMSVNLFISKKEIWGK